MQTFISETISSILNKKTTFENVVFILPSQRAGVFVKEALKNQMSIGFLPEILNIEQFIENVSQIQKVDSIQLLFHFYSVYKKTETKADDFDNFFSWATTVIQDFNEIDQHLVNPKEIFTYIRDIERLKKWSIKKPLKQTKMMAHHFCFVEKLGVYYQKFYSFLLEKNIGYQGLIYREAVAKINEYLLKNQNKKFYFIGFNTLNKAEEFLFQQMLSNGNTEVYWDIDEAFLKGNHQAGRFIRKYKNEWKYYLKNSIQNISSHFNSPKNIHVIGASKNIAQIKYAGELLDEFKNHNNTAYVLGDESLLPIALNSLPKKIENINITMGYPLKDIPTTSLFHSVFQLFINQEKLQKTSLNEFYYKDIIRFLKQTTIQSILNENDHLLVEIEHIIAQNNITFISHKKLEKYLHQLSEDKRKVLLKIFSPFQNSLEFIERILSLIDLLKNYSNALEKEYLFRFHTAFTQIKNLQLQYNYLNNLKTIHQLFKQLIQSENISFKGEPLKGLQLMGMLETRTLDFENLIIASVNENILPKGNSQKSFIPFDVKLNFKLPTHKEKDAVFSYHFFRLLQRAKNIYLIYNSENDTFGGGEKSRFISQLLLLKDTINNVHISSKVITESNNLKEIVKNDYILETLKEQAKKGFSPSTLTNYLRNPFSFYEQKVLGLKEYLKVEETVAANTMGTIIHETLDALYKPYIGKNILEKDIDDMHLKTNALMIRFFKQYFNDSDVYTGKNKIIFEVSKDYINRFLASEKQLISNNNSLKIIGTEQNLEAEIEIEGFHFPIKIKGQVDRIDELNGVTRIIDYKTGKVESKDLKIKDLSAIVDEKYSKAIQVLLYAFLYQKNNKEITSLESGIISFKNLKSGLLKVDFNNKQHEITSQKTEEFMTQIKKLIKEIFNKEIPFTEKIYEKKW